ncbi:MAG: SCO family protein [Leptospira sp.]|nr:SCO family protein [Leptospira sp.]
MSPFLNNKIQLLWITFILFFIFLSQCSEKEPNFPKELTFTSSPTAGILPFFKGENMDPYWKKVTDKELPSDLKRMPEFSFTTHNSTSFSPSELKGKYTLVTFFYAKCNGICPMITANMKKFLPNWQKDNDVQLISISVNPEVDTVKELMNFRKNYKINENKWTHLTGDKLSTYTIAREQFGADVTELKGAANLNDFVHTENVFLLDPNMYLRGIYRAKGMGDLERLLIELKTLRQEFIKNSDSKM